MEDVPAVAEALAAVERVRALAEEWDETAHVNNESACASRLGSAHGARHTGLRDGYADAADRIRQALGGAT